MGPPSTPASLARERRWLTAGAVLSAVLAGAFIQLTQPVDLAEGLGFTQSSKLNDCNLDRGECGGLPARALFHTREETNPWYRVDLRQPTDFTSMTIINRGDMGEDRAVPLAIEISDDGETFREIARKTEPFTTWLPQLGPQRARFVRLRVDRRTYFHLQAVRIHP